jgi:ribose transport system substrate-binding protein
MTEISRRKYAQSAGIAIVGVAAGAAIGYGASSLKPSVAPEKVVTQTVTAGEKTITKTVEVGAGISAEELEKLKERAFPPVDLPPYRYKAPWLPRYFVDTRKWIREPPWVIGFTVPFMGNNWKAIYQAEVLEWAKNNPKVEKVIWIHHNNDASDQIAGIRDFVSQGVDGIVVDCASATALAGVYKEVWDAGIPLVSTTDPIDSTYYVSATVPSLEDRGYKLAKGMCELMGGKGNIIRFWGMKGASWEELNQTGFDLALAEYPGIKTVATGVGLWDYTESKKAMRELIPALPEKIDGILSDSGQMTLGIADALEEAGFDVSKMVLTGDPTNGVLLITKERGLRYVAAGGNVWEGREACKVLSNVLEGIPVQKNYPFECRIWGPEECKKLADPDLPRLVDMDTTFIYYEKGRKLLKDLFMALGFE